MDFSTEFVALRDRLQQGQDKAFRSEHNVSVAGRMAALMSTFDISSERKLLGMMPTGTSGHAHEYRLLFAVPTLDEAALADWWAYAQQAERELVHPDAQHEFSIVSVILATQDMSRGLTKKLRRLAAGREFKKEGSGWSSVRIAAVNLCTREIATNRMGDTLRNVLRPIV